MKRPHAEWMKKGPLDLTLNTNLHTVARKGKVVEFQSSGRAWQIFLKLVDRFPARYLCKDLGHDAWNAADQDIDPDDNLVQQAISTLRKLLKPLGIEVQHRRKLGYILDILDNSKKQAPPKATKAKSGRKSRSPRQHKRK